MNIEGSTDVDPIGPPRSTRRGVLAGAAAAAVAVVGGCAKYGPGDGANGGASDGNADPNAGGTVGTTGEVLAHTGDIPVGGGKVLAEVVVTQPKAGSFKCFTNICTHQGCMVADVAGGTINCACHGSKFSIVDGSVVQTPAQRPLRSIAITVEGDTITLA